MHKISSYVILKSYIYAKKDYEKINSRVPELSMKRKHVLYTFLYIFTEDLGSARAQINKPGGRKRSLKV